MTTYAAELVPYWERRRQIAESKLGLVSAGRRLLDRDTPKCVQSKHNDTFFFLYLL